MIIREYAACEECDTVHVLRVGVGGEPVQAHQFACRHCGEEMNICLEIGAGWTFGPNAALALQDDTAPIVNLHPSFVFSKEEVGSADAFPSLDMGSKFIDAIIEAKARAGLPHDLDDLRADAPPQPRTTEEWGPLRAAWSLTRNGKHELAANRLTAFMAGANYPETPDSVIDWVFQFSGKLTRPHFERHWEALFDQIKIAVNCDDFGRFIEFFGKEMSPTHARRHFEVMKGYLGAYSEFSQVHQSVASNIAIDDAMVAASSNFSATRMIYGDMFEAFGSNIETLVALNNLIAGRPFDQLQNISLAEWQKTDKAGHGKALEQNAAFAAVCEEMDAQLRNGSHHGGMILNRQTGAVEFRAGKGGQGDLQTMSYARYLARCSKLFIQEMLLMRVDIFVAHRFGVRLPL